MMNDIDIAVSNEADVLRDRIADALTHIEMRVPTTGPSAGLINAGSFADAIIELCGPIFRENVTEILEELIVELRPARCDFCSRSYESVRNAANHAEDRLNQI